MVSKDHLLGLNMLGKYKEFKGYTHCIIKNTGSSSYTKLAAPCIVDSYSFSEANPKDTVVLFPFAQSSKLSNSRQKISIYKHDLMVSESKPYVNMFKVVSSKDIDLDQIEAAIMYANEHGAISLQTNPDGAREFLRRIDYLFNRYKFHTFLNWSYTSAADIAKYGMGKEKATTPCITIFDISHCIPIFNTRRVDGIGLLYEVILEGQTKIQNAVVSNSSLIMVFSQFKDNLFYLDGEEIATPIKFDSGIVKYLYRGIDDIPKLISEEEIKKGKKQPKQEKKAVTGDKKGRIVSAELGVLDVSTIDMDNSHFEATNYIDYIDYNEDDS